jgi:ribonuclease-3
MELSKRIGYHFKNESYLDVALTHASFSNESRTPTQNNERQEFLGDAILSIVVSDYLYRHTDMDEGDLTKRRAALVCEATLSDFAREIDLGRYLRLGRGEEHTGGRERASILADAFEALIAAIYLDGGLDRARDFILPFVKRRLAREDADGFKDYKTQLQEIIQKNPEEKVQYVLVDESGPDHDKRFVVEVRLNSNVIGRGQGRSKKAAEQLAAREALALMGQ